MDRVVENDTHDFHWRLSQPESRDFLEGLFPDSLLFGTNTVSHVLHSLRSQGLYGITGDGEERWASFPETKGKNAEGHMAAFLNKIVEGVEKLDEHRTSRVRRRWSDRGAKKALSGSFVQRKPDLVLMAVDSQDWRDVLVFGEMKSRNTSDNLTSSYKEIAGKTTVLLYAQDGRHATPTFRILGASVNLTFFDRGGSLETYTMDIHADPEVFLRILIGLSKASLSQLGFDVSLLDETGNKRVLIKKEGKDDQEVIIDKLLFISDILHGRGTTVWGGTMGFDSSDVLEGPAQSRLGKEVRVAVKDSWLDPIRKYTEGFILKTLNDSRVTGVPTFIHEQQVQAPHPTHPDTIFNSSTHLLRAFLSQANRRANRRQYQLRFLSRLVTTPVGIEVLEFNSLAELLVIFIDYVLSTLSFILFHRFLTKRAYFI